MYNVVNSLALGNPSTDVQNALFAKTLKPRDYTFGRQTQYSLRLHFSADGCKLT
jgi:hypothetical protein